jgi:ATP-binding cassette subfamily C (CFTR/MRP) protein 4
MVAVAVPEVLPLFIPVLFIFWWVRRRYLRTSREVKRFEATTRSPVFASFSSILKVRRSCRG